MKLPKNQNFLVLLKNGSKWRIIVTITAIVTIVTIVTITAIVTIVTIVTITAIVTIVTVIAIVTIVIAFIFKLIMLS